MDTTSVLKAWLGGKALEALEDKLQHFSQLDPSIFNALKFPYIQSTFKDINDYIDYINNILDINGIFLDCILYRVEELTKINLNTYVLYDNENSHYIVTVNRNRLKELGPEFWGNLSEFDYECSLFLLNSIDHEIYKNLV